MQSSSGVDEDKKAVPPGVDTDKGAAPKGKSPRPEGSPAMLAKLRKRKRTHAGPPTHEVAGCDPEFVGVYEGEWEPCWVEAVHAETKDVTVIDSETRAEIFCERVPNRWLRVREVKAELPVHRAPAPAKVPEKAGEEAPAPAPADVPEEAAVEAPAATKSEVRESHDGRSRQEAAAAANDSAD